MFQSCLFLDSLMASFFSQDCLTIPKIQLIIVLYWIDTIDQLFPRQCEKYRINPMKSRRFLA